MNAAERAVAIYEALRIVLTERVISRIINVCEQVFEMDSQAPPKPWERRIPGAMSAPQSYR